MKKGGLILQTAPLGIYHWLAIKTASLETTVFMRIVALNQSWESEHWVSDQSDQRSQQSRNVPYSIFNWQVDDAI